MVVIKIELNKKSDIVAISSKGHVNTDKSICAAVSTLEYTFLHSVKCLIDPDIDVCIKDGDFSFYLKEVALDKRLVYNNLCRFYLLGIEMLKKEYPQEIKLFKAKR